MKIGDILVSIVVIFVILLIIIPTAPVVLDILLIINISIALIILLITLNSTEPLQFSTFPSILLIVTIYRLGLNICSTRLILGNGGDAGNVIQTFGTFVIAGNLVVGFVIFLIILAIQFIVITKGSERVAEVAARFTLDAMPGKQMAIDADLNAGIIDDTQAKERRRKVQRESDFYGAMDGASKFVKGDAIISIIITLINVIGGIIIGMTALGMDFDQVMQVYTLATVGDGLVSQIPALLISTATGIIVTRAASDDNIGTDVQNQIFRRPIPLMVAGGAIVGLMAIPGLPKIPLFVVGVLLFVLGYREHAQRKKDSVVVEEQQVEQLTQERRKPESVMNLLQVYPIELEVGYALIPLVDANQGGDLLDRVVMIRRQCALDLGMVVPVIRIRDNIQIGANEYIIKIKGTEIAGGEVMIDHYLAMNPGNADDELTGIDTVEPAFGLPALWIEESQREKAEILGYTIVDPPSVIATHLTDVLKRHGHELLGRQQVQGLLDTMRQTQPALVDDVVPKLFSLGELQKILCNLLRENVSIRDLITILETLSDYGGITRDTDLLTEYVRQALKRAITKRFIPDNRARVLTLDPGLEQAILEGVRQTERGSFVALEPDKLQRMLTSLKGGADRMASLGLAPMALTSPMVRQHFKKLTEPVIPDLIVLSYNELEQDVEIYSDGVVGLS